MSNTMREILFRGKRVDNRKWVEGFYVIIAGENHCIFTGRLDITRGRIDYEYFKVDPKTVGQFTGLTDKNGNKIFEGDIIKRTDLHISNEPSIGFIEYDKDNSAFLIHWTDVRGYSATFPWKEVIEVIGNIHDNPELLEESHA